VKINKILGFEAALGPHKGLFHGPWSCLSSAAVEAAAMANTSAVNEDHNILGTHKILLKSTSTHVQYIYTNRATYAKHTEEQLADHSAGPHSY